MYERMLNKEIKPSIEDLGLYINSSAERFHMLNAFLSDHYKTTQEIRFPYGKQYGWCVTHRKGKKLICDVFAEAEAFTVMIRLSNQQFDKVYKTVQSETREMIDNKYPCGDGGWIHFRVLTKEQLEDIQTLLHAKCSLLTKGGQNEIDIGERG